MLKWCLSKTLICSMIVLHGVAAHAGKNDDEKTAVAKSDSSEVRHRPTNTEYVNFCVGSRRKCYTAIKSDIEKYPNSVLAGMLKQSSETIRKHELDHFVVNRVDSGVFEGILRWIEIGSLSGIPEDKKQIALEDADYLGLPELDDALLGVADLGRFVTIPGGTYQIGSPTDEPNHQSDEILHEVILSSFEVAETAVTQGSYALRMGTNPSKFQNPGDCPESYQVLKIEDKKVPVCADHPVENVNWDQANEFALRVSEDDPRFVYTLPTEAQQEVAFRGGTTTAYVSGDDRAGIDEYKWHKGNSGNRTHPVKSKRANGYGIFFSGVWEWGLDWYHENYEGSIGLDPIGPASVSRRVLRGGGWNRGQKSDRSAYRHNNPQVDKCVYGDVGFRLSRTPRKI